MFVFKHLLTQIVSYYNKNLKVCFFFYFFSRFIDIVLHFALSKKDSIHIAEITLIKPTLKYIYNRHSGG